MEAGLGARVFGGRGRSGENTHDRGLWGSDEKAGARGLTGGGILGSSEAREVLGARNGMAPGSPGWVEGGEKRTGRAHDDLDERVKHFMRFEN